MKHKHAELIKAWADGAKIQMLDMGYWHDVKNCEPLLNLIVSMPVCTSTTMPFRFIAASWFISYP